MPGHRGVDRGSDKTGEGKDPVAAQEWRKVLNITLIAAGDFKPDTADAAVPRATWASSHSAAASSRIRTCRSGPASVSPSHSTTRDLVRVRCARPHRLCDVRRGEVASRGLSAWSGRTRRCPRLRSASEFPENVVGAGDREGAVADGERHTLGRVAPDVAGGEDARAGGLYHAGLALCERPRLRPRGAGA